jgi:ABC-2 type transport system permease protein
MAAIAGIATQFFWGFMLIMIFRALYRTGVETDITITQLVTYLWLQQAFLAFTTFRMLDPEISDMITDGKIAYELTRPINLYWMWVTKLISKRFADASIRCLPIFIVAFLLPTGYNLTFPVNFSALLLSCVSIILGLFVILSISMLIYLTMFYTESPVGLFSIITIIAEFFSGAIIPIPLMPETLKSICYALPFRLGSDFPFRIYSGNIGMSEAFQGISIQILWIIGLILIGNLALRMTLKRVVVQGG